MGALSDTYQAVLLLTDASFRFSYAVLHVTCLVAVVAAELAVLAVALPLLLLVMAVPCSAVVVAGWMLHQWLVQHGLVADRATPSFISTFRQCWRQNSSQLSRASCSRLWRFCLSLPSYLPVKARTSIAFRLKQILDTTDWLTALIIPGQCRACTICLESLPQRRMVHVEGCSHSYCKACLATHLQTRLENNRHDMLRCTAPGCTASFSVAQCDTAL